MGAEFDDARVHLVAAVGVGMRSERRTRVCGDHVIRNRERGLGEGERCGRTPRAGLHRNSNWEDICADMLSK